MKRAPWKYPRLLLAELAMLALLGSLFLPWGAYPPKHPAGDESGTYWSSSTQRRKSMHVISSKKEGEVVDQNGAAVIDPVAMVIQQIQDIQPHTVSGLYGKTQRWLPGLPFFLAPILVGLGITIHFSRWPRLPMGALCAGLALTVFFMLDLVARGGFASLAIGGWLCMGTGLLGLWGRSSWEAK